MIYLFIALTIFGLAAVAHAVWRQTSRSRRPQQSTGLQRWHPALGATGLFLTLEGALVAVLQGQGDINWLSVGESVLQGIALAVLVAWVVVTVVERDARRREANETSAREIIAKNVIEGVYGLQYPQNYVRAVVENHLQAKVVRDNFLAEYIIRDITDEEAAKYDLDVDRFVVVSARHRFTVRNLSGHAVQVPVAIPIANVADEGRRRFSRIRAVSIGRHLLSEHEVLEDLVESPADRSLMFQWFGRIEPGESIEVAFDLILLKEPSDSEVWFSAAPILNGADFRIQVVPGMAFGLQPFTSASLRHDLIEPDAAARTWRIDGPVLAHEGVRLWWRSPARDDLARRDDL